MSKTIDILDFFDIHDTDHLVAFKIMDNEGSWPNDFLPDNIYLSKSYRYHLTARMLAEYLKEHLPKEGSSGKK